MIPEFSGQYRFLSNFWPCKVWYKELDYPSVENAYQAAKSDLIQHRALCRSVTAAQAKKIGKTVELREDWEQVKVGIMKQLLIQKFNIPELRTALLATGDEELIEGNWWGDTFWGVCRGNGRNMLGKLLMEIRYNIKISQEPENANTRNS